MSKINKSFGYVETEQDQLERLKRLIALREKMAGLPEKDRSFHDLNQLESEWQAMLSQKILPATAHYLIDNASDIIQRLYQRGEVAKLAVDTSAYEKITFLLAQFEQRDRSSYYYAMIDMKKIGMLDFPEIYEKYRSFYEEMVREIKGK